MCVELVSDGSWEGAMCGRYPDVYTGDIRAVPTATCDIGHVTGVLTSLRSILLTCVPLSVFRCQLTGGRTCRGLYRFFQIGYRFIS